MERLRAYRWLVVTLGPALIVAGYFADRSLGAAAEESATVASLSSRSNGVSADPPTNMADTGEEIQAATADDEAEQAAEPVGPVAPLTGLPVEEPPRRPALIIKIDNHVRARPQTALDQADIVFDMRAEGVTRFAAVFHSTVPDPVGPVRSSRTSDFDILRGFDTPLYASSGGNDYVAAGLRQLPIIEVTNLTRREYFRDNSRSAPHNLYVDASDLFGLAPETAESPGPWFTYRAAGEELPASARPATGPVTVAYTESPTVTHTWDESVGGWSRTQDGAPHTMSDGDQLAPENVVIFVTDYSTSPADRASPEVRSTGGGPLYVLTGGHVVTGRWERPKPEDKPVLIDDEGNVIALTPGRTWVLLPEDGQVHVADDHTAGAGN